MDYREEIDRIGDVVGESIAVGSGAKYKSNMVDSLLGEENSQIVSELEEKGGLRLNESGSLDVSPSKHEEVGVFERPSFTNADGINGSFPKQELSSKVLEQSDENQTVNEIDGTGENEQGTFPELSKAASCLKEERNIKSIESCPPIPEVHHQPGNDTGEPTVEDGKITKIPVPEVFPGKDIATEEVNEDAPVGVVEPNIEHETTNREKDDATDVEEPEIITYLGRDLVEEGYHGSLQKVGLENENVLRTEKLKGKGHSVFVEESGVEGDGLEKAIPRDSQFTENYDTAEKKGGEEIGFFSSNEDARKPVTEGGDETDGQIKGTVEPQVSEASFPEEKVDVEVPNEEVVPDILNVKDDSVDGLPFAKVSALRDKVLDKDEILKTSNDDAEEINFGDHKEEDVQEDDVIRNDGLSKDRELTAIDTVTEETGLPAPGAPSNENSASNTENDFAGDKNEGSDADWTGINREITDPVAIERDDASPDSNVFTEAIDGNLGNDTFPVSEFTQDKFQPDIAEKDAPSSATASNEFDTAGKEDTSSGLTLSGDQTTKDYEEISLCATSGEVIEEKAAEVLTVPADTVPGRDYDTEANTVKDDDTGTRKEDVMLESMDRDAETDDASDPIKREVPIGADSLWDIVQQETRLIPPEQESLMETCARSSVVEDFAEERNASGESLSTLEDRPLDVPGASSEVKHESEESNISEEVHLHAGLSALTDGANEVSETPTANIPEMLEEEKLDIDQRSAELDAEISSAVPVDSNIGNQSASNEASNYEETSVAEAVVTESKIPDEEKILKSFEQSKQDADEIDEDGKPTLTEGESEAELDEVLDREEVLKDSNTSAGNVLNDTLKKSEKEMNTKQPQDMADQGSHSDNQLASNKDPKYEERSAAEVVTNSMILEEKILAKSFDGESEAQIGQDSGEVESYEESAPGKGNSAREHEEVPAREEVPSVLKETIFDGVQQRDIANQTDIPLTEATVETTEKATVFDSAIDASPDNQRDISHFGTMTQDLELETTQKRDETTNDDAVSTLQDGIKIDTQTEETPDITLSETTDEVASKILEDDSFGVAGELSEKPIDGQSAFSEASNYEEASAAEAVVNESKIPEETATEEQLRQDTDEMDDARELDEVPNREVLEETNASAGNALNEKFEQLETEVSGGQPHDIADQVDVALTEVPGEPIEKDGIDTTISLVDQKDGRGDDQLASSDNPKHEESSVAEAVTESKILEEKILTRSFNDSLEAQIGQDAGEVERYEESAPGKGNSATEHNEVPAQEEVPSVLEETIFDGVQQRDIANQTDIPLTEATVETTEKATVFDSAIDASPDNQRDISHFGTMTQDLELETNQKRDETTNDDAVSTLQDGIKIDMQTEETPDITLSETADEVASKILEDDSFGVAGELSEKPIDGQSAFSEASNYEEASAAEAVVNESKIPEETATEEQLRQDTDETYGARELDEVPNREVLEATNASAGNALNEKFEQLETEVSGGQPHDIADQGDVALTEAPREPIEKDGIDTTISLVDQKDGRGDDQLASNDETKHEESSVAEAVTESEILEEKILTRSFNDSLEAQIGQDAGEVEKYRETEKYRVIALGEGNTAREHDEVLAREEVPPVLDETIVDSVQQQDITDQTDIALTEAPVKIAEKAAVYNSTTDASTNDQRDVSHFATLTQDKEFETNEKQDEPTNDDATSTCRDYAKMDTQTEETSDITLSETTNEVASKIQEDDSLVAGKVLENPMEESAIPQDETIKLEEISGLLQDVEEPALGQGNEVSSLMDDNINENERGTVGSSEFTDAADSVQERNEDGRQTDDINEPLTGTGITEDTDPADIVEKDLIDGMESREKIDAGVVASKTKDISLWEVEQYEQHVGESASRLQVAFSETPESEPIFDQTVVVDQTEEERMEIYDSTDQDGEIADPNVHQSSVNEALVEQTKEEKAAEEVDSNIVSDIKTGITDTEPSQISRDVDTESFEERNSATENTENKEYFYEEGKYNIQSKDRAEDVTRSEELAVAKETSDKSEFSNSELVESAVAEEGILDQGIGTENSYERDSSLAPPEENEVKTQEVPLGAATDSFSERQEQDKEAREPYEEIPHPEQRDLLVDMTEADYDSATSRAIPVDTQELSTLEGDIQKDEACTENKVAASENEGIRGLLHKDQQENAQGILAEEVALEGEIASQDVETDCIVQEDKKGNKEAENSRGANEDEINKDGEVDMELLATIAPATEMADQENKDSYTTVDDSHAKVIEGEKRDLNLLNEIADEGDSYSASADTPFSERSINDTQPGMSSENLECKNAGELNAAAESVEDVIATEVSDETALLDTPNETATTLQTQPTDHSYEQDSLESAPADGSTIDFNRENEQDRQDKTSDEQSSQVEIDNPELGTDTPTKDVPATAENVESYLVEMNEKTTGSIDVGEQKTSEESFFKVDNSLTPEAEVGGIESNEVLQNEAETAEGGSAEEAPQLTHYTVISSDRPPDEMSAFSTSVPNDVQEREISDIVASEDDQTSRTIQEASEHTSVDGAASVDAEADLMKTTTGNLEESIGETSVTVMPDENDDSNEEGLIVENQIPSKQLLESIDQQIEPIPLGKVVQEESDVESAPIGESTLDENLRASEKESESEGIQSSATNEAWSDGKELTLQTDISQDESDTGIPKYADKERDVTETEEITPLELGDRGFASTVQTKEISTDEEALKIKEVVLEDSGESIDDTIREVIPVTSDTQPSMSSESLDGETAAELNPTAVSVEDGAGEEEGTDAGIEEVSEALVDSKGHEEEATGQRELINVTEVTNETALSDVPDETTATIQTVPADDLYERDSVELTEESKVHVESATADGSTVECYGKPDQDMEDKTSTEQTSQVEIDNRDIAADMPTRDVQATAENVEIDQAAFDERTTRSSDIGKQTSTLVEVVERDQSRELSTSGEAFIQIDREDISLPPEIEVEVGGSESNEVPQKEAETKEGGSVEEAPQFPHLMEISSDGPSDQTPVLSTSVPDNVQEVKIPEIVTSEDDQTNRTILEELDNDSGKKVEQEDDAENEEKEIGIVHTQEYTLNEEKPPDGASVEETIASDQLTQEEDSKDNQSGENIREVIKDVYTVDGGVAVVDAVAGSVKPTEPTESTGNLDNESIGETSKTVMPEENDDLKEERFVELIPHEEAVIAETEDVEPVSVGESMLDQSPLADVSQEESTLLHARTEAWSDGNESTLQTDVCQDEMDSSMSKFADKERDVQESEKITPFELGNRDFASDIQTKEVLTEEDTSKIKEVVSESADESVNDAIREVIPTTSDAQPSTSGEYLDSENVEELNSATVLVKNIAGKEDSADAIIEDTSEALINSKGHEVEASGQRDLTNATEVSDEAALPEAPNEMMATIQTVPTADGSAMEFYRENEQEVQDKTFNEQASQVEIDNQDLAADMPMMDVLATVENVEIDRAELDKQTDGIGRSLPPEAETGGNERNQVLQNQAETKEEFSGEEALQSMEISSDGPSDQMSAFTTSLPDAIREREIRKIVASEDDQTSRTIQEELDDESRNKVEQEDNAEKVEQEVTSNEERPANGESVEETISSDQLTQFGGKESNGSLGGENVSEVIKDVHADVCGVPAADAEADITNTTQPTQITGNLKEESIENTSPTVIPDENYDSKEQSSFEAVPREEATLVETEDIEPASVGKSTLEKNPLSDVSRDEYTLLHAQTEAWRDGNECTFQTDVHQDESDTGMPKYAEKEIDVPATGKITPLELGEREVSSAVPTKEILTEEDASKNEEVEVVDVAADHTEEQPSVTTEDMILKEKEERDDAGHAAGKPKDMIETYEDKTSVTASFVNAETTIPCGNEKAAEVDKSVDDVIGEVAPMTSDSSSAMTKEGEMIATETKHEKENAALEISQRNLTDTADLKDININEMAVDIPSTDRQAATGSVSDLPQGSIDAITTASVDQESASLTLPSEETVADKAWTSRESPEDEHLELGFKETGMGDDTAKNYGESRSLDFTSVQADQETNNEINGGEILSDGYGADKADYGLVSEVVEIADKVDPSLKGTEEKAFEEAQILQEKASQEQDEYKQGDADEDKAPIVSDANDPVEEMVDPSPPDEAEGQTFGIVEGDRKVETSVPNIQGSSEEISEGDRMPALEESKGHNQVIASKEDAPTTYHDSGLPRDASLAKGVTADLPGSTERGLPPTEAREFRDQSEVNLDGKEFEEKFSADTTTVSQTPVVDNLQLPEQSPIIKPDDDHEDDDHEYIEHSDAAPLMVELSKDVVDGKARQKKSHSHLLSGMSSKVKSSISKVKKVITGKSSNHNKEHSPKHGL